MMRLSSPLTPGRHRPGVWAPLAGVCALLLLLALSLVWVTASAPARMMVAVTTTDDAAREASVGRAIAILRARAGVTDVRRVDPDMLARMAGADAAAPALPALIEVTLNADADPAALARALAPVPHVAVQPREPAGAPSPLHRLAMFAALAGAALLIGGAVAMASARLTQPAVAVALLRELGAEDVVIARHVMQAPALDLGAGIGGALAVAVLLLASAGLLDWRMAGWLAAAACAMAALALAAGGMTVLALLRRQP